MGVWDGHNRLDNLQYGYLAGLDTKHTRHASSPSSLLIRHKRNRNRSHNRHAHHENQETALANLTSSVVLSMKSLKVSDAVHRELTRLLGEMMAQSGKPQTISDVIEALVSRSVLLPAELLRHVEEFIEVNKLLGYTTREEFIREALNETLGKLSGEYEYVKSSKENLER